jgi:hypothetical protein
MDQINTIIKPITYTLPECEVCENIRDKDKDWAFCAELDEPVSNLFRIYRSLGLHGCQKFVKRSK